MPVRGFLSRILPHAVLVVFSALIVLPLLWLLRIALTDKVTAYKIPPEWGRMHLANFVEIFTDYPFFGTVIQGQRGDCISMQWANYLYSQDGRYHDENWNPLLDSPEAVRAMEYYREAVVKYSPSGSESYCFDEAFNVMAQGKAYSFVTFNILYAGFEDPESSTVAGKVGIAPNPGGGLNGGWGWAIPNSSPNTEAAWSFIKWAESPDVAKERALPGGAPTQAPIFTDPDVVSARPYYPILGEILAGTQDFPVFTYTTEFVEEVGRELNLAATGQKPVPEAMAAAQEELRKLLVKDGKISE